MSDVVLVCECSRIFISIRRGHSQVEGSHAPHCAGRGTGSAGLRLARAAVRITVLGHRCKAVAGDLATNEVTTFRWITADDARSLLTRGVAIRGINALQRTDADAVANRAHDGTTCSDCVLGREPPLHLLPGEVDD